MIRETEVGEGDCSVISMSVCVHTVKSVVSPCRDGDMLVKPTCSVRHVDVVKVSRNHEKCLWVFILERADVVL